MTSRKHEGFKVEKRKADIVFAEDSPWHGVEAEVITSIPFKTLLWFQKNAEDASAENTHEAIRVFADQFLVSWNVIDDDGKPYPASAEGVEQVPDYDLVTSLLTGWIEAVTNPPMKSSAQSNGSGSLAEESMELLASASTSLGG